VFLPEFSRAKLVLILSFFLAAFYFFTLYPEVQRLSRSAQLRSRYTFFCVSFWSVTTYLDDERFFRLYIQLLLS
jgi:hypothetical protein